MKVGTPRWGLNWVGTLIISELMKGNIMTESQVMVARSRVDWFNVGANMGASEEIVGIGGYG